MLFKKSINSTSLITLNCLYFLFSRSKDKNLRRQLTSVLILAQNKETRFMAEMLSCFKNRV